MIPRSAKAVSKFLNRLGEKATDRNTGLIQSWTSKETPSKPSITATALFVSTCLYFQTHFNDKDFKKIAGKFAKPLKSSLFLNGGAGSDGTIFLFDTQIALHALWELCIRSAVPSDWKLYFDLTDRVRKMVGDFVATEGIAVKDDWTAQMASHLLKFHPSLPVEEGKILFRLAELPSIKMVMAGEDPDPAVHTQKIAYAVEGLLQIPAVQHWQVFNAASLLAKHQNEDGGVARYLGREESPSITNATAQAIRIWCLVDAGKFQEEIQAGLIYLDNLFDDLGVCSFAGEDIHPVHATLFSLQASSFANDAAEVFDLI